MRFEEGVESNRGFICRLPFVDVDVDEASPEAITASVLRRSGVLVRFLLVLIKKEML